MNRTGLIIALAIAAVVSVVFGSQRAQFRPADDCKAAMAVT
ncbi:MAG TPA: hypothetical protein VLN61_03260 [Pseudolabrys sp.]|nr:hypothetical protein [Pseudolabrys sp.]